MMRQVRAASRRRPDRGPLKAGDNAMMLKELAAGGKALKAIFAGEPYPVFERDYAGVVGVIPPLTAALRRLHEVLSLRETDETVAYEPYLAAFCEAQWYGRILLADPHSKTLGDMVRDLLVDIHAAIDPDAGFRKPILGGLLASDGPDLDDRLALLIIQCEAFGAATRTLLENIRLRPRTVTLLMSGDAAGIGTLAPMEQVPQAE